MINDPLVHLLHSIIVGLLLYLVFRYIMLFKEHPAIVSAMLIAAIFLIYLITLDFFPCGFTNIDIFVVGFIPYYLWVSYLKLCNFIFYEN